MFTDRPDSDSIFIDSAIYHIGWYLNAFTLLVLGTWILFTSYEVFQSFNHLVIINFLPQSIMITGGYDTDLCGLFFLDLD